MDSTFLNFDLYRAAVWCYFSLLLAVALFFKFARLLSVRNLDLLGLYVLTPGLLLLLESDGQNRWGFVWLLGGSGFWLLRCLLDLTLVRRPALSPNLNLGGLAWLAGALFVSLVVVTVRQPASESTPPSNGNGAKSKSPVLDQFQKQGEQMLRHQTALPHLEAFGDLRLGVERSLAILCHLAVVVGLVLVGWRHFHDVHAGMAAATLYLLLPYPYLLLPATGLHVPPWQHLWPMAVLVWAIVAYRRPTLAGLILGLAAGSVYFPVLLLPIWLSFYWKRGMGRFLAAFVLAAGLCLAGLWAVLWREGELPAHWTSILSIADWQPWLEPPEGALGIWMGLHWAYRIPIFVAHAALLGLFFLWPAKNLAHLLALSAAALIGAQFWYADQGGVYVLWYLPFLVLMVFRPNLAASEAPPIVAETDWLRRLGRWLYRRLFRTAPQPEPALK